MCGIAGFVGALENQAAMTDLQNMIGAIIHRGPDRQDWHWEETVGVGFSHTRLSIVDLSEAGNQPMASSNGRYLITFNGEIYNFHQLKQQLQDASIDWQGSSDTEVFVNCIEVLGLQKTLELSCGMFAFALLDRKEHRLLLCRDRAGEKPLYYSILGQNLIFASELSALTSSSLWREDVDTDQVGQFMQYGYVPTPFSIYKNTFKLPPGCFLDLALDPVSRKLKPLQNFSPFPQGQSSSATVQPQPYWRLRDKVNSDPIEGDFNQVLNQFSDLFKQVVTDQMISDVPIGAFLSGGVDSSLVVATMQAVSSEPVKTFSIGFTEKKFNEAHHAKSVAEHLGTDHTELYVTPKEARDVIPSLPDFYSEPFADSSQIPTYLVSKLARQKVTVSLSGDAGDELFGGYTRYFLAQKIWNIMKRMPDFTKSGGIHLIQGLSLEGWDSLYGSVKGVLPQRLQFNRLGDKLYKGRDILRARSNLDVYRSLISQWQDCKQAVPGCKAPSSLLSVVDQDLKDKDFREQMMYLDFCTYLSDDILVKVDRAAMAVSLESRVPLLDPRVIEFAWNIPLEMKMQKGSGKRILRELLYRSVPRHLIERPKMGFGVPVGEWMRGPLKEWGDDLLSQAELEKSGILDVEVIQKRWREHQAGRQNWQASLWCVLMFQQWYNSRV